MLRRFFKAVLSFMLAFALSGLHTIMDGFFMGRSIGDLGLVTVNIAYPMAALVQAAGTGIGTGGAVWITLHRGKQEGGQETECLGNITTLLLSGGPLVMALLFGVYGPVLRISGAEGRVYQETMIYIQILAGGSLLQFSATGFAPLIRNYNGAVTAMVSMIAGFVTNTVPDYLFVAAYHYGVAGAAAATVIRQGVTVVPYLVSMWSRIRGLKKKDFILKGSQAAKTIGTGISPFGLTISPLIVIALINRSMSVHGGEAAVAAYMVVPYVAAIVQPFLQGIGDGSQPLVSFYLGTGEPELAGRVRSMAYIFAVLVALANAATLYLLREMIPGSFGASGLAPSIVAGGLPVFSLGFIFITFCRTTTSYFYVTKRDLFSYVVVYGEPVILRLLLFLGLPLVVELYGVWLSVPLTQAVLVAAGIALLRKEQSPCSSYVAERLWIIDKKIQNKFRDHGNIVRNTVFPLHPF